MLDIKWVSCDAQADAIYIRFAEEPIESTEEVGDNCLIDWGKNGVLVGLDLTNASRGVHADGLPRKSEVVKLLEALKVKVIT